MAFDASHVFEKDPDATLDFSVDWTDFLEEVTDTIVSSVWEVPAGITSVSEGFVNGKTVIFLSGGTVGTLYEVVNRITTDSIPARIDDRTVLVFIIET